MNFLFPYSEQKLKAQLKMASHRINVANNKRTNAAKHAKREIATLLADQKNEKARIKVEHIIREDFMIESYELLGLMCDLLHERIPQITMNKECPIEMKPAVCSIIWACDYVDFPELKDSAAQLIKKFGDKFAQAAKANEDNCVNERLYSKLVYKPPSRQLVARYLRAIAAAYDVECDIEEDDDPPAGGNGGTGGGGGTVDVNRPFSAPVGYSIPMAPGSGLTQAYTQSTIPPPPALPVLPPSNDPYQGMNEYERAEREQFLRNQVQLSQQPNVAVPVATVYSACPPPVATAVYDNSTDNESAEKKNQNFDCPDDLELQQQNEAQQPPQQPTGHAPPASSDGDPPIDDFLARLAALQQR